MTILDFVFIFSSLGTLLGAILMLAGWVINVRTDRSKKQKILWSIPIIAHLILVSIIVILNHI